MVACNKRGRKNTRSTQGLTMGGAPIPIADQWMRVFFTPFVMGLRVESRGRCSEHSKKHPIMQSTKVTTVNKINGLQV